VGIDARLAASCRVIAVCDTSACTFRINLHADVSQTAIMEAPPLLANVVGKHWAAAGMEVNGLA